LADLKRMGLLNDIVGGRIRAITWKRDDGGLDKLGFIPNPRGIRFVKLDDEGKLAGLFAPYFYTPAMFGGYRKWFACPDCRRPARILYGVHTLWCRRIAQQIYSLEPYAQRSLIVAPHAATYVRFDSMADTDPNEINTVAQCLYEKCSR